MVVHLPAASDRDVLKAARTVMYLEDASSQKDIPAIMLLAATDLDDRLYTIGNRFGRSSSQGPTCQGARRVLLLIGR